jgi:hypothetical protein
MTCLACALPTPWCCIAPAAIPVTAVDVLRAPGLVEGLMPRRPDGGCAQLAANGACGIYEQRPQACRDQRADVCLVSRG